MKRNTVLVSCFFIAIALFSSTSCTLDEKLNSTLTEEQAKANLTISSLLATAYNDLDILEDQGGPLALEELTSDEQVVPTRGSDWDDNGAWRVLHAHTWTSENVHIVDAFNNMLKAVFDATNVLDFNPSPNQAAQAKFIRAFAMYIVLDLYGQVPYRDPGENLLNPSRVYNAADATNFIISDLESSINDLDDGRPSTAGVASKNAARVLLMKLYLNRATYGANRQNPVFDDADMNKVISYANAVTGYQLATRYFDNYVETNSNVSVENIFVDDNTDGTGATSGNGMASTWMKTLHYNQNPGGWNGFATFADVYNKFEASDSRRTDSVIPATYGVNSSNIGGVKAGILRGQQYNQNGKALTDRKGNPLIFLDQVSLNENDPTTLERTGLRVVKYPVPYKVDSTYNQTPGTDYVFFRYADVLLMKAEADLRLKTPNIDEAVSLMNQVRTPRGASALVAASVDSLLSQLLDERQREFYWDGWRRQDLIRFGKFLDPWSLKTTDAPKYLWFPIPSVAVAVNPNLVQNTGY